MPTSSAGGISLEIETGAMTAIAMMLKDGVEVVVEAATSIAIATGRTEGRNLQGQSGFAGSEEWLSSDGAESQHS